MTRADYGDHVRALLKAMVDPTPEMVLSGHLADPLGCDVDNANELYPLIWRAMIEKLLGPEP